MANDIVHSENDNDTEVQGTINVWWGTAAIENTGTEITHTVTDSFDYLDGRFN